MGRAVHDPLRSPAAADPLNARSPSARARDAAGAGLYVHVPFCAVRCTYCHFATVPLASGGTARWLAAIEREARLRAPLAGDVGFTSVFFGGGTPSVLSPSEFARLVEVVRAHVTLAPGAEVTLEANPESVTPARLEAWRAGGVNRLSLGAQSFHADELRRLGRVHGADRPGAALADARAAGFTRLSLDLMYGFPGHTPERFAASLARALASGIEHLSAYAFIADPGNPLGDAVLAGEQQVADDAAQAEMHAEFVARSAAAGLALYETSNVARPGAEARHNLAYWLRRDGLALGPSAHALWRGERYANLADTDAWARALERGEDPAASRERPTAREAAEEVVMLALRLDSGLRAADYDSVTWAQVHAAFADALAAGVGAGRLEGGDGLWRIPDAHRFLADDTIAWLAARARD